MSRNRSNSNAIVKDNMESEKQRANHIATSLAKTSEVFLRDPRNTENGWQILCLTQNFMRRRGSRYLGFSNTSQLREWEESNSIRWAYLTKMTLPPLAKVPLSAVMCIICNSGGAAAEVAAYIKASEPWTWSSSADEDFTLNRIRASAVSKTNVTPTCTVIRLCSAIIWLIRSSHAQFPDSGHFTTPHFWYAPEDVNRAFWYLSNLRYHPEDRQTEGTQSTQPAKPVKMGVDAGLASLHNSVVKGEWSGRFLRKDIVARRQIDAADNQGDEMRAQLLRLRKWAYKTYPSFTVLDESELDKLMDVARRQTKPQDRNMDVYRAAYMDVELLMWTKAHPDVLEERAKDLFADFKMLHRWLHGRRVAVEDDSGVSVLMGEAVEAVAGVDRSGYIVNI